MSFKSLVDNYREHGLKYFTFARAKIYFRSLFRKVTGLRIKEKDAILFSEAITYKALTCPDCAQLGHCRVCKCPINELFSAMDAGCSDGKFPAFEQKRDWETIRYELKKGNVKEAFKEYRKKKTWKEGWEEYKKKNNVSFIKFYG